MAHRLDTVGSSESVTPTVPATGHRVSRAQKHDRSQDATTTRHDRNVTPPPRPIPFNDACIDQGCRSVHIARRQPTKRVYSIETLLRLRQTQSNLPVMLRIKPEAIAENIFQYMGANRTYRYHARSRGLSELSNISRGSFDSHDHGAHAVSGSSSMGQTLRQPIAPPETSILQRHDGFARFLKQHASPPHHRVTAGGRIVPAGPSSPPPMFDFASLNELLREQPGASNSAHNERHSNRNTSNQHSLQPQLFPSMNSGGYLTTQGPNATPQQASSVNLTQVAMPYNNATIGLQPVMGPVLQSPTAIVPIGVFPDGSTLVSYNGINYRTYWNGVSLMMEPINVPVLPVEPHFYNTTCPQQAVDNLATNSVFQPVQVKDPSAPLTSATDESRIPLRKFSQPPHVPESDSEEAMKSQLSNLDKHLALYHYEITPAERTAFIAQRRHLVEQIDKIRVSKDQTKRQTPLLPKRNPIAPVEQVDSQPGHNVPATDAKAEAPQRLAASKGSQSTKCLSPAAPPFVPKNMQNNILLGSKARASSEQIQGPKREKMSELYAGYNTLSIKDVANAAMNRKEKALQADQPDCAIASHQEQSCLSPSVLDPSDPAMRVIEYEDIEYAARYLYNWDQKIKIYCTTLEEFQEAIRRVREQARMYGCAGGSSKDPAYDAEQDLWWAICDRDPIPLPTKIPDHVTNPRPWNWNDSAFNYRRKGAPLPGPTCEQARNSPRLSGWDPAITESMKDIRDVSRSYYALKGQLPSVPFRNFAYDLSGNKVKIEPEVTDPGAKFGAARVQKNASRPPTANPVDKIHQTPPASLNALRDLTNSDVNGRQSRPPSGTSRAKSGRKKNFTDGDAIKSAPPIYKDKSPEPVSDAASGHKTASGTAPRLVRHLYQSYLEDGPDTPIARHIRADSKGSPTPRKNMPINVHNNTDIGDGGGNARKISSPVNQHTYEVSDPTDRPVEASSGMHGTSTGPNNLEELARLKARYPGDPDILKMIQAQTDGLLRSDIGHTQTALEIPGSGSPGRSINQENSPSNTWDLSIQTRSQWVPDDDTPLRESCDRWGDHVLKVEADTGKALKAAKVKIPNLAAVGAATEAENDRKANDTNTINATRQVQKRDDTHNFLRKMLKGPPYTSVLASEAFEKISAAVNDRVKRNTDTKATDKGRLASQAIAQTMSKGKSPSRLSPSNPTSPFKSLANSSVSKAQVSMASAKHQAHGVLPHFEDAGEAHESRLYCDQSIQLPLTPVRGDSSPHHKNESRQTPFPSPRYQDHAFSSIYGISLNHGIPINFGCDGGADSPAPHGTDAPSSEQQGNQSFDYKGVTTADYNIQREDHDNTWHRGKVEDFFEELREREKDQILAHRADTKRVA